MNASDRLLTDKPARLQTTHWSVALRATQSQLPGSHTALALTLQGKGFPIRLFQARSGITIRTREGKTFATWNVYFQTSIEPCRFRGQTGSASETKC